MATSSTQPPWYPVQNAAQEPDLKILNTLTRSKTKFVPASGKTIKWYNCGPTVYDHSHLGHARNYVSLDIIRRILVDYFNYDVFYVMNITDIDDKIIQSSRKKYLFNQFKESHKSLNQGLIDLLREKWAKYFKDTILPNVTQQDPSLVGGSMEEIWTVLSSRVGSDKAFKEACLRRSEKFDMQFQQLNKAYLAIQAAQKSLKTPEATSSESIAANMIDASYDVLTAALDSELKDTVTSQIQALSRDHARYWEGKFMEDMRALRVQPPDLLTRVTEFVPEIVRFIEKVVSRGFAYEVDGSVYFDTQAFDGAVNGREYGDEDKELKHWYLKLEPWSKNNNDRAEEGEGALIDKKATKKSKSDFALWKSSKPGEPSWPSPWGNGRPGWHIECSVMASEVFGDNMDIHSGGEDLTFPHHDNELAQSEAYHDCKQWVNYFIHIGHLHIEGLKMSKSLKNFITVEEILTKYSARQLRLAFMAQLWSSKMDFQEGLMKGEVKAWETTFNNFFANVQALIRQAAVAPRKEGGHNFEDYEKELSSTLLKSQADFRNALCDSFNTTQALDVLLRLVSETNKYISSRQAAKSQVSSELLSKVAVWITRMLRMFGLGEGPDDGGIGWGNVQGSAGEALDSEKLLMPYLEVLSTFRDTIRQMALDRNTTPKDILKACDVLRDDALVPLGVALDDQEDGRALVKLVPPEVLLEARRQKRAAVDEKAAKKAENQRKEVERQREIVEKGRQPPSEMFKGEGSQYSSWDVDGFPLTTLDGKELSKSETKKLRKIFEQQGRKHAVYQEWIRTNSS